MSNREALENGVSKWPSCDGRFPQVSGLRFTFDPTNSIGNRVVSVLVDDDKPIDLEQTYKIVITEFIKNGKEGYTMFSEDVEVIVDSHNGVMVSTCILNYFTELGVLSAFSSKHSIDLIVKKAFKHSKSVFFVLFTQFTDYFLIKDLYIIIQSHQW